VIPLVVAIERGTAQTDIVLAKSGLKDYRYYYIYKMEFIWKVKPQGVKVPYMQVYIL
jgi:hypothetical protein